MKKSKNQTELFYNSIIIYLPKSICVICTSMRKVSNVLFLTPGEPCKRFRPICDRCRLTIKPKKD